jgi:hypothetical protein
MNTQMFDKIKESVEEANDYCRLLSFKTDIEDMFTEQLVGVAVSIAEFQSMTNPLTLVGCKASRNNGGIDKQNG